jgi:hypothetical protein
MSHPPSYLILVDFENVPKIDLGLVEGRPVEVVLLIGKNQKKLDLALVRHIHRLAAQVELVEVGASGRNALDLTLAFYLGEAAHRVPGREFAIVSGDKDFDPMISHLRNRGRQVAVGRYGSFAEVPFLAAPGKPAAIKPAAGEKKPSGDRRSKVLARLRDAANPNRPSSRKALVAYIKAALGKDATEAMAEEILATLLADGALSIDGRNKVSYRKPA